MLRECLNENRSAEVCLKVGFSMLVRLLQKCGLKELETGLPLVLRKDGDDFPNCKIVAVEEDGSERTVVSGRDMLYLDWKYSVVNGEATLYAFDEGGEWKARVTKRDPRVEEMGLPAYGSNI